MSQRQVTRPETEPSQVQSLLRAIDDLPSIPETLLRTLKVLDDPNSSAKALADIVATDAPLTAKILRLANSPFYTSGGKLADIQSCVAVLGYKTVRQVAICVSIATSLLSACNRRRCRLDYRELWRHSVVTGAVAKHLAEIAGERDSEEVFTAGLLHDLGKFVIVLHVPATYDRIIEHRNRSRLCLTAVESDMLGYDHTVAGEAFGQAWRFPELITRSARLHHDRWRGNHAAERENRVAAIVTLADHWANELQPPHSDLGYDSAFFQARPVYAAANLKPEAVQESVAELQSAIDRAGVFFELD